MSEKKGIELSPAARMTSLKAALEQNREAITAVSRYVDPKRLAKVALVAASKNPTLLACTPASIVRSVIQAAELGLDPSGSFGGCHLVPFRNKTGQYESQLIVDYRGLIDIAYRTGAVKYIEARVVYEDETFEVEYGARPRLLHVPNLKAETARKILCFYAVAHVADSEFPLIEVMTKGQVDGIRNRSRAGQSGPWQTDYEQMGRKTVIKRIFNYIPRRPAELARAIETDNENEFGASGLTVTALEDVPSVEVVVEPKGEDAPAPQTKGSHEMRQEVEDAKQKIAGLFPTDGYERG